MVGKAAEGMEEATAEAVVAVEGKAAARAVEAGVVARAEAVKVVEAAGVVDKVTGAAGQVAIRECRRAEDARTRRPSRRLER